MSEKLLFTREDLKAKLPYSAVKSLGAINAGIIAGVPLTTQEEREINLFNAVEVTNDNVDVNVTLYLDGSPVLAISAGSSKGLNNIQYRSAQVKNEHASTNTSDGEIKVTVGFDPQFSN